LDLEQASRTLEASALLGGGRAVHLCNAYTLALASRAPEYARLLNQGYLNLPDGAPLVFVARRLGIPGMSQDRRARGTDVFCTTLDRGRSVGLRHYLYGSTPGTVAALRDRMSKVYPGVDIVGAVAPPFRALSSEEEAATLEQIRAARPHIVWVALGTPQQDEFVARFAGRLGMTLVAVGAAFDFLAGTKPQAPRWMQSAYLEWLFRLVTEPSRLWKRYLVGNLVFLIRAGRGTRLIDHRTPTPLDPTP
jgi:N-acetylglucosaminyldiphosphoundecaprenol N-acetyl-beta-D-mannosaminyltransferase